MEKTTQLPQIVIRIIKEQELIIGPLAWDEAKKVKGLHIVDSNHNEVGFDNDDPMNVVDRLVAQYERIFGRTSREVCKDAVSSLILGLRPEEIPSSLK
ncbi:MAG: hypothetical protein ACYCY6_03015 [Minisyncoccota bacterium]